MVFMGTEVNWDRGRSNAGLFPSYVKFPDQFYGIGREVTLDDEEDYTPETRQVVEDLFGQEMAELGYHCNGFDPGY